MIPSRRARLEMFARSFAIQGSWNYRTLIGNGFAFALLPALREIFRGRPADFHAAVERHTRIFNSHPYLVGLALGAVARLEAEGATPAVVDRFKSAVRGSLGSLGDRLIWAGLRPATGLLALALLFAGLPWWLAVLVFLSVYNIGHVALRIWGFQLGFRYGKSVGEHVSRSHLAEAQAGIA
ncbi:MAG: PTS system mannose/fructose/sorbose family transporter subunit IID, partial [Longimicrobiales bacterium]